MSYSTICKRLIRLSRTTTACLLVVAALSLVVHADAQGRDRELLNRLVQSGDSEAATRAFTRGRSLIDERRWDQAVATFSSFINEYPSDRNVDAAMYFLAYAYEKQGMFQQADDTLRLLVQRFPRSNWADDARKLRLQVRSKLDPQGVNVPANADDELRIIALQSLCQSDRARCSSLVNETLRSNPSPVVKRAAVSLLGRYGGADAVPTLMQMARNESEPKIRMEAISALGKTGDERGLDLLRELAMSADYEDESPTDSAIHALVNHESPRATGILTDVVINGRNLKARQHAVALMGRRRGDTIVDDLFRIYEAVPDVEIRKYVLLSLGHRKDPRATSRLVEVARGSGDPELRRYAIRAIPEREEDTDLDILLSLYDSERDAKVKDYILEGIGRYKNPRAYQKLMQVVRDANEPLERRKRAVSMLSRSKDPAVMRFLEEMVK